MTGLGSGRKPDIVIVEGLYRDFYKSEFRRAVGYARYPGLAFGVTNGVPRRRLRNVFACDAVTTGKAEA